MKVLIRRHLDQAGFWIYTGYASAWKEMGYDVYLYNSLEQLEKISDFYLMAIDSDLKNENIHILSKAKKTFLFVQPNSFPDPWGKHPNFKCVCSDSTIELVNNLSNVIKWTFVDCDNDFYNKWKPVTVPLAFDDVSYIATEPVSDYDYDICYVGGRANNGFDEKIKIINYVLSEFEKTNLKCGFFVGKNISHSKEIEVLSRSKLCLNIHDEYQRRLSLDANERTFKSLGLNGTLLCENILQIKNVLKHAIVNLDDSTENLIECAKKMCNFKNEELLKIKNQNIDYVKSEHTYKNRILQLLSS